MKTFRNEQGIALITAIVFTFLTLAIVTGLLYMITQNTRSLGSQKIYRNTVEASYGGVDVVTGEILPQILTNVSDADLIASFPADMNLLLPSGVLKKKLLFGTKDWDANIGTDPSLTSTDARQNPDAVFSLKGTSGQQFVVRSKVVDNIPGTPYISGLPKEPLIGIGVVNSEISSRSSSYLKHYVFRIEIAADKANNPKEKSDLSALYEY